MSEDLKFRLTVSGAAEATDGFNGVTVAVGRADAAATKADAGMRKMSDALRGLGGASPAAVAASGKMRDAVGGIGQAAQVSAAQTAAAFRMLPAQMTDIVTQLAGGASPALVLLQQGGQIKDSFGGIGNAARALASVLSPLRLAMGGVAAVAGTMAAAYYGGWQESKRLADGLALSGNMAAKSAGQIDAQADALARSTTAAKGDIRELLTALASSGQQTVETFDSSARAALALSRLNGKVAADNIAAFDGMGESASAWALKTNKAYHFLTAATFEQIRALEEQGRNQEAARVGLDALAGTLEQRTAPALGTIERALKSLSQKWSEMWDAAKGVGRDDTAEAAIAKQAALVQQLRGVIDGKILATMGQSLDPREFVKQLKDAERELQRMSTQKNMDDLRRSDSASNQRAEEATIARRQALAALNDRLAGTNSNYAKSLRTLQETYEAGELPLEAYRTKVAKLIEIEGGGKDIANKARAAAAAANGELGKRAALLAQLSGLDSSYGDDLKRLSGLLKDHTLSEERYVSAVTDLIAKQPFAKKLAEEQTFLLKHQAEAQEEVAHWARELAAYEDERTKEMVKAERAISDRLSSLKDENAVTALAGKLNISLAEAVERVTLTRMEDARAALANDPQMLASLERQIAMQRQLADTIGGRESTRSAIEAWRSASDSISGTLRSAFTAAFDASGSRGKAFAKALGDQLRTSIFSAISDSLSGYLVANLIGVMPGSAGASGYGSALQGISAANSLYNLYGGGGLTGSALAAGNYASVYSGSAYGTAFGSQQSAMLAAQEAGMVSQAGGASMSSMASYAGWAALAAWAAAQGSSDWSAGLRREQARDTNTAIGDASARTAQLMDDLGVSDRWADILSGATLTARIGKELGLLATPHMGGYALATSAGVQDITKQQGGIQDATMQDMVGSFASDVLKLIGGTAQALGATGNVASVRSVFESDNNDPSWGLFHLMNEMGGRVAGFDAAGTLPSNASEGFAQYTKQAAGAIVDALTQVDIPKWAKTQLGSLGDALDLTTLGTNIAAVVAHEKELNALTASIKALGPAFQLIDAASSDTIQSLIDLAGGVDQFNGSLSAYVQNYYSENERTKLALDSISATLADVGLTLPSTREQFRAMVDALDPTTEAGLRAYTAVMSVQQAFADAVPAIEAVAAVTRSLADIARERYDLETQLLTLQGNTAQLRARELEQLDPSNRALQEEIWALQDQQAAAAKGWSSVGEVAASSAGAAANAWESVWSSISDEVKRLRGSVLGNTVAGMASLQAQFATATASARAGSADAGKQLPELSKQIDAMALKQSRTRDEYQIQQAELAASLEKTLATTGAPAEILQGLRGDVQTMSADIVSSLAQLANLQAKVYRVLDKFDAVGMPDVRS
ncbi:MAG: phage tail length tape measure family protein [Rubrivivax sp.]